MTELLRSKDVLAGLLFAVIGALAVFVARAYPLGSTMRMGPGYFPTVLGGILVLFGAFLIWRGARGREPVRGGWGWRPLAMVTLAMLLFGFTITRLGLIPALFAMFFVCALGGREFRLREVLALAVAMNLFAVLLFVYLLKLPYRLILDTWYW